MVKWNSLRLHRKVLTFELTFATQNRRLWNSSVVGCFGMVSIRSWSWRRVFPGVGGWTPMMYAAKNGHLEIVRTAFRLKTGMSAAVWLGFAGVVPDFEKCGGEGPFSTLCGLRSMSFRFLEDDQKYRDRCTTWVKRKGVDSFGVRRICHSHLSHVDLFSSPGFF